jgi:hypothetical protein
MNRVLVLAAALVGLVFAAPARAAVILSFDPASSIVDVGDVVDVDVVVSGLSSLEEILSAFDLDVTYNNAIVDATGVTFGPHLGDESQSEVINNVIDSPGRIDFAATSLLSDGDLYLMQPDPMVIATLSFVALAPGTTPLIFDPTTPPGILLVGFMATPIDLDLITALPGEITVRERVPTPEPSTLLLGLVGLLAAGRLRAQRPGRISLK